ncbi:MAG: hypothetical protein M1832_005458 [Thelocarpon impressellum]|nr:MAG: hypothetical protein M1832_005458 [Thelocarpon impressellum]
MASPITVDSAPLDPAGVAEDSSKAKRQLLSCTSCRKRKVKCDRVHPCQACCGRGLPKECEFVVNDREDYEPIAQSYEIRKLRVENERLKMRLRGRQPLASPDESGGSSDGRDAPTVPQKPSKFHQRRFKTSDRPSDNLYFGSPGLANVVADFANMHVSAKAPSSVTYAAPRGEDVFAFQDAPCFPFGTFWRADGLGPAPVHCLPPRDEIFAYLDAFQKRAQSCSFPHVPEEITRKEVERFLENSHDNAVRHPAMLALIFAALAQGLQNGVYDKSGGRWVAGAMEAEAWKGDMYIAAAMQCLRMASFLNRPTLLCIQTLIMIGPYLTNAGKFLDAWALFGTTIRLAHSIGLHRNPKYLDPAPPLREGGIRQVLWWWMLHMDQQYSMTLGRPLGISGIGDCPPPEPLTTNPTILRLSEYINLFTILSRQILSSESLARQKIDESTDQLLALRDTLPDVVRFDESWNNPDRAIPEWPLDAMAAVFYGKTHTLLILLNRQRQDKETNVGNSNGDSYPGNSAAPPRGRERVLASARALLAAFEFFHTRVCAAMICWTMGQQAFNAAMLLALALLHPRRTSHAAAEAARHDHALVQQAWVTFREMEQKGIHKLAGVASSKIYGLLEKLEEQVSGSERAERGWAVDVSDSVMGNTGMLLLEDPGLQAFVPEPFEPLGFQMAGAVLSAATAGMGSPAWAAQPAARGESCAGWPPQGTGVALTGGGDGRRSSAEGRPPPPVAPKPETLKVGGSWECFQSVK